MFVFGLQAERIKYPERACGISGEKQGPGHRHNSAIIHSLSLSFATPTLRSISICNNVKTNKKFNCDFEAFYLLKISYSQPLHVHTTKLSIYIKMTNKVETANTNSSLKEQPFYLGRVVLLNLLLKLSLFGTDHSIHFLPFLQQQKRRHCLHSKFLCHPLFFFFF